MRRALLLAAVGILLGGSLATAAEDPQARDVYVRARMDIGQTVRWLEREAERVEASQVLFVFDAATFAPPPGLTEFSMQYAFFQDLGRWCRELETWAGRAEISLRGTSSLAPLSIDLTEAGALERLQTLVQRSWWKGEAVTELEPAARWMKHLLARTESALGGATTHGPRLLVLVSGAVTPERWIPAHRTPGWESAWRTKLRPVGDYFDEQAVGTMLQREGCRLYVVAPEAYFGDFSPMAEMPPLPWAARPEFPPDDLLGRIANRRGGGTGARPPSRDTQRQALDEMLKGVIPDPEARRKAVEAALEQMDAAPPPTTPGRSGAAASLRGAYRHAGNPLRGGDAHLVSDDRRACSLRQSRTLRLRRVALGPGRGEDAGEVRLLPIRVLAVARSVSGRPRAHQSPGARAGEPHAVRDAAEGRSRAGCDRTSGRSGGGRHALGGLPRRTIAPVSSGRASCGRAPCVWTGRSRCGSCRSTSRSPTTSRTSRRWGSASTRRCCRSTTGRLRSSTTRSPTSSAGRTTVPIRGRVADLRLARFWFAMSAFHLEAFSIYARELDRFIPASMKGHVDYIAITYVPTIRMSDCLEGYDPRSLTLAEEAAYGRWAARASAGVSGESPEDPGR